ncbi:MAG: hypothetical protein N5P05_002662 [Chroococcopsis gigantea SAG 12.99]|jgi:hypothetical protein|nr:hypothetical protein [Chlorogloea purpurea SAG 13.99]MDV3001056.1 hypothetical protein [Chroococcopsis gigantea SAG 12.99]
MEQNYHADTCEFCPFFKDYDDSRGRGWCLGFDRYVRKHHRRSWSCELLTENRTVMVQLYTRAVEEDDDGYPVPVDSHLVKLTVAQPTRENVEGKIRQLFDLSQWEIGSFWEPCLEREI